ncbi:MAG: AAA family ATPase [Microthrixaceae bacterium]
MAQTDPAGFRGEQSLAADPPPQNNTADPPPQNNTADPRPQNNTARGASFGDLFNQVVASTARALHGKSDVIRSALTCLLAEGHLLIEDVPGVGKTTLAKALARSLNLGVGRIQFTPDLLPADVVGSTVWNSGDGSFEFHPGPVFTNLVLGDEINRASPKTQSALLEAMEEHQVTADGTSRGLPRPFMVIATQNPAEHHGTFPLPESQLDRFLMRLSVGYPSQAHEVALLSESDHAHALERVEPVVDAAGVLALTRAAEGVHVETSLAAYVVELATMTRDDPDVILGVSPRACLGLLRAARVNAASQGRNFVTADDVKQLAEPVLAHRLVLSGSAVARGNDSSAFVNNLIDAAPITG